jgi:dipicolinate synthase subunit A
MDKKTIIFSGVENKYIKIMCEINNLSYEPLMNSDYVSILNAVPTTEGIIAYIIENTEETIMGSKILVIGNGRCGKVISKKLSLLGANVFVNTLKDSDYAWAIINKIAPVKNICFADKKVNKLFFDVIINTAPCETISKENLYAIANKTLLIDITSFGFDINIAKQKNEKSNRLLSIPSKFALKTSGEILGKFILERMSKC